MVLGDYFIESLDLTGQQINSASVDMEIDNGITLVHFNGYKPKVGLVNPDYDPYQQILVDANEYEPIVRYTDVDLDNFTNGLWVRPGVGVLCTTKSHIKMPKDVVGQILLKSSRGREFYQSCMAGFIDNGFEGQITLEIYAPVIPIFFQTGLKIVQLRFDSLDHHTFDYSKQPTAKYQNQSGATPSKDSRF